MLSPVPWADPRVSLREVQARFQPFDPESTREYRRGVGRRRWRPLVGFPRQLRAAAGRGVRTETLVPGQRYIVLAYTTKNHGTRACVQAAAVLRFERFVAHPDAAAREAHSQYLRTQRAERVQAWKESDADDQIAALDSDDDDAGGGDLSPGCWRRLKLKHLENEEWLLRKGCNLARFTQLDGQRRAFDIDVYGPGAPCGGLELLMDVLPLASEAWGWDNTAKSSCRIHSQAARQAAAVRIQRRWRQVAVDDVYPVWARCLMAEFQQEEAAEERKQSDWR